MNIKSLRDTPETNIMYVNYTSMKARKETGKKEIIFIFFGNQLLHQEGSSPPDFNVVEPKCLTLQ